MEDLRNVMRLVDENATKLPEGDYLDICNGLQKIYRDRERREIPFIFDYENFNVFLRGQPDDVLDYFYDNYFTISLMNEDWFLTSQRQTLMDELKANKPIKRISKNVKYSAIRHYCRIHKVQLSEYTEEKLRQYLDESGHDIGDIGTNFDVGIKKLYKSYIAFENEYRRMYAERIYKRINAIDSAMFDLEEMQT
jgi:hypothetical protein